MLNNSHLTNAANLDAGTGQGTQGRLSSRAGGLGLVSSGRTQPDVQGSDAQLLQLSMAWHAREKAAW